MMETKDAKNNASGDIGGPWIFNSNFNGPYGPRDGNLGGVATYVSTNPVLAPQGQIVTGFQIEIVNNILFPVIQTRPLNEGIRTWQATNTSTPGDVFPQNLSGIGGTGGDTLYVDTTQLFCPQGQVIVGIGFTKSINRISPVIGCADPMNLSNITWVGNNVNTQDYFENGSNLSEFYVDLSSVSSDDNFALTGFSFRQFGGNRIAFQLLETPLADVV